jgi:hypothetical protein
MQWDRDNHHIICDDICRRTRHPKRCRIRKIKPIRVL